MCFIADVRAAFRVVRLLVVPLLFIGLVACSTAAPLGEPSYQSVRERLADGPTRLLVHRANPAGAIVAASWTRDGWTQAAHVIAIDRGEVELATTGPIDEPRGELSDELTLSTFELTLAPIPLPSALFKVSAQLTDLRLSLRAPVRSAVSWSGDDALTSRMSVSLDLDWAITIEGGKTPLGTQHLPPMSLEVSIEGKGDVVESSLALTSVGELWNWIGLLKLEDLELELEAATIDSPSDVAAPPPG
jgi:hypothetical protein